VLPELWDSGADGFRVPSRGASRTRRVCYLSLLGNLADLGLGDIFQIVSLSRRSGTLQLTTPTQSGEIVFNVGRVVAVYCSTTKQTIGEGFLEKNLIAPTVYQDMLAAQGAGITGMALFARFDLKPEAVTDALEDLLKTALYDMFVWEEGTFSFVLEEEPDPWRGFSLTATRVVVQHGLNPQYLAIEGARVRDERTQEDTLESFLARDKPKPTPAVRLQTKAEAQSFAARLHVPGDPVTLAPAQGAASLGPQSAVGAAALSEPMPAAAPAPPPPAVAESTPLTQEDRDKVIPFPTSRTRRDAPAAPPPSVVANRAEPVPAALATDKRTSSWRLLIIDDDPQITKILLDEYAGRFAGVSVANAVTEALPEIESGPPGLVVASDLIIARSDGGGILGGLEIAEKVRQRSPEVPIILFSDYENGEAEAKATRLGVAAFLMKPRKAQIQPAKDKGPVSEPMRAFMGRFTAALEEFIWKEPPGVVGPSAPSGTPAALESPPPAAAEPPTMEAVPTGESPAAEVLEQAPPEATAAPQASPVVVDPETDFSSSAPAADSEPAATMAPEPSQVLVAPPALDAEALQPVPPVPVSPPQPLPSVPVAIAQISLTPAAHFVVEERGPAPAPAGPPPVLGTEQAYDLRREVAGFLADVDLPGSDELPETAQVEGPMAFLRSMLGELVEPSNRDNVTLLVLRYASYLFERSALFLVTRRGFIGLGGFSSETASDEFVTRVRKVQISAEVESLFGKVVKFRTSIRGKLEHVAGNEKLINGLGAGWPEGEVAAMPLTSGDRVAAILYGDNPSGRDLAPTETLDIFLQQAGLAMERALLERRLEESRQHKKNDGESE
jgi:ActR/RegA family two-component response regulator